MKLTLFLFFLSMTAVFADANAQRINLRVQQMSLQKVLVELSKQSAYTFVYNDDLIGDKNSISIELVNSTLQESLDRLLNPLALSYQIKGQSIAIKRRETSASEGRQGIENAAGDQISVKGRVINEKGEPLTGASIYVLDANKQRTTKQTNTDTNGYFELKDVTEGQLIEISYLGYQSVQRNAKTVLGDIVLQPILEDLKEVEINAGYYTVKDRERTGSIARVTAKEIENQPVNNVLSAIQGRMAGVSIVQNSGVAGGGFDIQIRGRNSIRDFALKRGLDANTPLYVIDGIIVNGQNEFHSNLSSAVLPFHDPNPLNFLSPSDIESIEVLKDADATAIYGSRGANGVILITTKKGKNAKTTLQYATSYTIGEVANLPKMMSTSEYLEMRKNAFVNDGLTTYPANAYDINGAWDPTKNTDWQRYFVGGRSARTSNEIRLSGGSAQTQFMISGGHQKETTIFPGDYRYKKTKIGLNLSHESIDKRLKLQLSAFYTLQKNFLPPTDFMSIYQSIAPNAPDLYEGNGAINWANNTFANPMAAATQNYKTNQTDFLSQLNINYKIIKELAFQFNTGYTSNDANERMIYPKTLYNPIYNYGSERSALSTSHIQQQNWMVEPQLNYQKKWERHKIEALVGATFQHTSADYLMQNGSNFTSDEFIENMGAATTVKITRDASTIYRYTAIYGRFNYQFANRYYINLTGRRDGSSRFGPNNRFANFGAVGAAWVFSNEKFLEDSNWLSFGKIRTSYGTAGSDHIGNYQFYDTYNSTTVVYNGTQGITPSRLFNANYGWETTRKFEIAMELGFLQDRIQFTSAYYRNRSGNQLVGIPLPTTTGFTSVQANLDAVVQNQGVELTLSAKPIRHSNFQWESSFNFSVPQNKLISFPNLEASTYASTLVIGQSMVLKKMYHYLGVDPVTGVYQFEDVNNDEKLDANDRTVVKELGVKWYGGLQNTFHYKNFQLDVLMQVSSQTRENIVSMMGNLGTIGNYGTEFLDYWTPTNTDARYQKPTNGVSSVLNTANANFRLSDAGVMDSYYIRLKNIQFSYQLPRKTFKRFQGSVFFQGQNLWTSTNYKGLDPEFNLSGYTPALRTWSFGFNLTY
ncbi:SusC/RagA family TonB-linked outer membrane protein [Sphingobacterium faecale]|uniref:SusC/RagA family TonB-linked outer membrane protein n=1 Tax=Sphingobacterium faecale TaxID=2803775 RepID=A0ABS1RCI0_9SPHI|nr:SusC/RagA family TonB-linked outer membrane protein [Sphingobacterium faecale]MBL1411536.1 SusC/RagA family TonB-linked outer membrane protein [Sphingobacterium faecale]